MTYIMYATNQITYKLLPDIKQGEIRENDNQLSSVRTVVYEQQISHNDGKSASRK